MSCLPKVTMFPLPAPVDVEDLVNQHYPAAELLGFRLATYAGAIFGGQPGSKIVSWHHPELMHWENTDEVLWFAALLETMPRSIFESITTKTPKT